MIGRHILIHTQDPTEVLRRAVSMVRTGGLIAFQEFDVSSSWRGNPEMPLMVATNNVMREFFRRALPRPGIGTQLPKLMQDAGLPPPECRAEFSIDGGPHSPLYKWVAESVRSVLPRMEELGLTTAAAVDIDTLEERPLRAKIAETTPLALITEQGENRNQLEKQWNLSGFPHGFACRGT